ncbi:VPLPA-CTERM sorting domain-containing protein [Methyloglobulus sp.]|uniref:VPLPA-CTERM sorting domain-containing protein n=1 Tax=Methyloglobulus sp. TaxID=2518622 RepID=UPI0032B72CD9
MNKLSYFLSVLILGLFSSVSLAATVSFYGSKFTSGPNIGSPKDNPTYVTDSTVKNFSIDYSSLDLSKYKITSAFLKLKAVDDNGPWDHCTPFCTDGVNGNDTAEKAIVKVIESSGTTQAATVINAYGWYDLGLNVSAFLADGILNGTVLAGWADGTTPPTTTSVWKCSKGGGHHGHCGWVSVPSTEKPDLWYKNIELVVDYELKPVPVPAAVWLFGSALLGLTGMKRKPTATAA